MKTPIAVALIIMGGLLVMTPPLADYLHQRNVVALLSSLTSGRVTLEGKMTDLYRFGCWFTGSAMIGVAVVCSLFGRREAPEHKGTTATQLAA
jgi:hypothetical protein